MIETISSWWWISIGVALAILEILMPTYFFLWLSLAGFLTGVITWAFPKLYLWQSLITFSFLSVGIMYGAKIYRKLFMGAKRGQKKDLLNNRLATYHGRVTPITKEVVDNYGEIYLDDMPWRVKASEKYLPVGAKVKIVGDEGMLFLVDPIN